MTMVTNQFVNDWVKEMAELTKPERIVWVDGSKEQLEEIKQEALATGEMIELNQEKLPGCLYYRTKPKDVARDEKRTVICTRRKEDAGPTNNWVAPDEMYGKLRGLFDGSMKGRTMYAIPFSMGVPGTEFAKIGIELTDSIYVVLSMNIMTRVGAEVIEELNKGADFTKCLHSKAEIDETKKYIAHFPEDNTIWSINSAYGGNVLLGKKCLALRIGSFLGKQEGWMAEHMLILKIENKEGEAKYVCGAFPSACGKTNLAMLTPPDYFKKLGYKVSTVGDDISWLRIGSDGRLYAVNPENGFFGVAPGTNEKSNPNALRTTHKDTIFTNVARNLDDNTVWWEKLDKNPPETVKTGWEIPGTERLPKKKELIRIPDLQHRLQTVRQLRRNLLQVKVFLFLRLFSAAEEQRQSLLFIRQETGITVYLSVLLWHLKQPQPQTAKSVWFVTIRWQCFRSADIIWRNISSTGLIWERR